MELLQDAEVWIAIGMVVFFVILIRAKAPGMALKALDDRAAKIQAELNEALRLRQEAQALLASIKSEREAAERLGAEIIANAEADAKRMRAEAQVRLEDQIRRRRAMAERRIANAEIQAALEVKAAAAEAAANLAERVLAERLRGMTSDPLVDRAVAQLAGKLQ
ncbi:MAG TPA: ATP F0F1 synthase subunit B [Caulobacteraceae bacterium]|jgi:F-type H+-transporting ATPase subunit b|nr:ATP F0F1 synthase subunit B [Caulobacteraceae bacterium]